MHIKEGTRSKQLPEVRRGRRSGVTVARAGEPEFKAGVDQESRTDRNLIRKNQQPESCEVNLTDTNASPLGTSHTPLSTLRAATIPKAIDLTSSHKAINLVHQVARDGIRSGDRQNQILTTPTYIHTCTL